MTVLPVSAIRGFGAQRVIFRCFGTFINQYFANYQNHSASYDDRRNRGLGGVTPIQKLAMVARSLLLREEVKKGGITEPPLQQFDLLA